MNFNNLDWRYIMEIAVATIVGALIAVAGSIIVNWFGNRKGYNEIDRKLGSLGDTTLSGQHKHIDETIENRINNGVEKIDNKLDYKIGELNNTTLSGQNEIIIKSIDSLQSLITEKQKNEDLKDSLLSVDAAKINSSISSLDNFAKIMKDLTLENAELKQQNKNQQEKIWFLEARVTQLQQQDNASPTQSTGFTQEF